MNKNKLGMLSKMAVDKEVISNLYKMYDIFKEDKIFLPSKYMHKGVHLYRCIYP